MSPDNATYLIGAMITSHPTSKKRRVMAVIPVEKDLLLILAGMEETFARPHSDIGDIRVYRECADDPTDFLGRTLGDLSLSGQAVGVELEGINARDYLKLLSYAGRDNFTIEDASELLEEAHGQNPG
jgi:Xaa-Pro aminopeptidase